MLVLSRKPNQSVMIGENIKVTVVRVRGNVVSLGIEAPQSIRVMREEIINRETKPTQPAPGEHNESVKKMGSQSDDRAPSNSQPNSARANEEIEIFADVETPLTDLDEMLYSPEDYADRCRFGNPLAEFMFAP